MTPEEQTRVDRCFQSDQPEIHPEVRHTGSCRDVFSERLAAKMTAGIYDQGRSVWLCQMRIGDDVGCRKHMPVRDQKTGAPVQSLSVFLVCDGADPAIGLYPGVRNLHSIIYSRKAELSLDQALKVGFHFWF